MHALNQIRCVHCDRVLMTAEPGRLVAHGAVSIQAGTHDGKGVVECCRCGRETPLDLGDFGLRLLEVQPGA